MGTAGEALVASPEKAATTGAVQGKLFLQHQPPEELGEELAALGGRRVVAMSMQCGTRNLAAESTLRVELRCASAISVLAASSLRARLAAAMWRLLRPRRRAPCGTARQVGEEDNLWLIWIEPK